MCGLKLARDVIFECVWNICRLFSQRKEAIHRMPSGNYCWFISNCQFMKTFPLDFPPSAFCSNHFVRSFLPPSCPHVFRVRQFIEMVNGTDSEVRCLGGRSPKSQDNYPGSPRPFSSPSHKATSSQPYLTGVVQLSSASLLFYTSIFSLSCFFFSLHDKEWK